MVLAAASYHTVQRGDTLYLVAKRYGVTLAALRSSNNLSSDSLYPGQTLIIPGSTGSGSSGTGQTYIVQPGDTLWQVSVRFGVSVDTLKARNGLSSTSLYVGQKLVISGGSGSSGQTASTYTVKAGDSLYLVAQRLGTSVTAVKQANGLTSDTLRVGQVLRVPGSSGSGGWTPQPASGTQTVYLHSVQWGETLWNIAYKYGVTGQSIINANMMTSDTVRSWMALIIPNPVKNYGSLTTVAIPRGFSVSDYHKLARMIYSEAGSEPYVGQVGVGAVILNRIENWQFPNTMTAVLTQKWQFEPVLNGYYYEAVPSLTAYKAARDAVNGSDPTGGALFFFNPSKISNKWLLSKPVTLSVGEHAFAK